jgi:hypothetical protein
MSGGRALSDRDLAEVEELCRALEQKALAAEELQAVERLSREVARATRHTRMK